MRRIRGEGDSCRRRRSRAPSRAAATLATARRGSIEDIDLRRASDERCIGSLGSPFGTRDGDQPIGAYRDVLSLQGRATPVGSAATESRTNSYVTAPSTTSSGSAACWSRAAVLTVSPVTSVLAPVTIGRDDRPGVDTRSDLESDASPPFELIAQRGERERELRRSPDRSERIVFTDGGDPEDGHHGVADVLLDVAAVALDDGAKGREVAGLDRRASFGIQGLPPSPSTPPCRRTAPSRRGGSQYGSLPGLITAT